MNKTIKIENLEDFNSCQYLDSPRAIHAYTKDAYTSGDQHLIDLATETVFKAKLLNVIKSSNKSKSSKTHDDI